MTVRPEQTHSETPVGLYVYWCPICKVATGERPWHSLRDGGLIPQNDTEHTCVKYDVSDLAARLERAERERDEIIGRAQELAGGLADFEDALERAETALRRILGIPPGTDDDGIKARAFAHAGLAGDVAERTQQGAPSDEREYEASWRDAERTQAGEQQ